MRRLLLMLAVALAAAPPAEAAPPLATCFWEGPISTQQPSTRGFDGRNFNFPEESATYWMARFNLPAGTRLVLRGRFPHGRYMSLNAYSDGVPSDSLSDVGIRPNPGATNPFRAGNRRDRARRGWRIVVLDEPVPAGERRPNTIYAQPAPGEAIELFHRVYEPDRGLDLTGGVGLPRARLVTAAGDTLTGEAACAAVNDPDRSIPVQTIAPELWRAGTACRPAHPAFDPIRWERFFNLDYASASVPADCTEQGFLARRQVKPQLQGGFYSNRDSAYVFTHLSRLLGEVVVVRGKLPRFPRTRDGRRRMGRGQVRFWSLCTGESRVTTRTPDCLADEQVVLGDRRSYTIVVSKPEDRPANAVRRCGVSWLDMGDGDGDRRSDYAALIMRNMLVSPTFARAIQRVGAPGEEAAVMGPYFPRSEYRSRAQFEALGCPAAR